MKKLGLLVLIISMFVNISVINVKAEEVSGLSEKLDALIMEKNFTQEQFEEMDRQYLKDYDDWFWNDYLEPTKELGKMHMSTDEEEYEYCLERNRPNYEYGVLVTTINTNKYSQQYATANEYGYLLDEGRQYWAVMPHRGFGISIKCRNDGSRIYDMKSEIGERYEIITLTTEAIDFIKNGDEIQKQLLQNGETFVSDVKVFSAINGLTFLYIRCNSNEYLIKLYGYGFQGLWESISQIEKYKIYSVAEVMDALSIQGGEDFAYRFDISQEVTQTKPTYTTEAESLRADGLLNGNEKGLDLLKPLTRIEATAMLVRAMGYESDQTSDVSYFSDIKSDNWGAKYANIAKDKGITAGVGDNMFAPDELITSNQFATLILRNTGENPDWQTAINEFIDRRIITSDQADKMDLFTRGDMAKIIYEAKQKGLL